MRFLRGVPKQHGTWSKWHQKNFSWATSRYLYKL